MATVVKSRIVKIGNSQGVRIPKVLLEQLNFTSDVELEVQDAQLIVRATSAPRANWAVQFERMAVEHNDALLDPDLPPTDWEEREWEW
jgi:antitoxin MazE